MFRIITAVADLDNAIECVREVLPRLDEVGEVSEERRVREKLRGMMMSGDREGMRGERVRYLMESGRLRWDSLILIPLSPDATVIIALGQVLSFPRQRMSIPPRYLINFEKCY